MNQKDTPSTEDFALRLSFELEQTLNESAAAVAFFFFGFVIRFHITAATNKIKIIIEEAY